MNYEISMTNLVMSERARIRRLGDPWRYYVRVLGDYRRGLISYREYHAVCEAIWG